MADVFYSISPFGTGDIKTGSPTLTISGGVATLNVAQTGNIGVGCRVTYDTTSIAYISAVNSATSFDLITAVGAAPSDEGSPVTVDSIAHEYASLFAYEAGYTDASHINNTNLATANIVAYACCYYDHDDSTVDSTLAQFDGVTTSPTYFIKVFTPQGGTESINNQRHDGKWNTAKYILETALPLKILENDVYVEGLQIGDPSSSTSARRVLELATGSGAVTAQVISHNIIRCTNATTGQRRGIEMPSNGNAGSTVKLFNNIIYDMTNGNAASAGMYFADSSHVLSVFNNTIYNAYNGINEVSGTVNAINNAVFTCTDDFVSVSGTIDYNASDDGDGTNSVSPADWTTVFEDVTNRDFHLKSTDTELHDSGTDDPGSGLYSDDIDSETRVSTWDISADEVIVAAGAAGLSNPLMGPLGGPLAGVL